MSLLGSASCIDRQAETDVEACALSKRGEDEVSALGPSLSATSEKHAREREAAAAQSEWRCVFT